MRQGVLFFASRVQHIRDMMEAEPLARERKRGRRGRPAVLSRYLDHRRRLRGGLLRRARGPGVFRGRGALIAFPLHGLGRAVVVRARACAERRRVGSARLRDIRGGRGRGAAAFAASRALPRGTLRRVSASVERGGTFAARLGLEGVARRGGRVRRAARRAHRSCRRRGRSERGAWRRRGRRVARARATPKRVPPEGSSESFKNFKNRNTTRGSRRLVDVLNFARGRRPFRVASEPRRRSARRRSAVKRPLRVSKKNRTFSV